MRARGREPGDERLGTRGWGREAGDESLGARPCRILLLSFVARHSHPHIIRAPLLALLRSLTLTVRQLLLVRDSAYTLHYILLRRHKISHYM